ncbi:MAG: hypothetical protein L6Q54_04605 [Leptospiraceae bacterium]|nr:hypothetical protein [Leptospiraceae bacterium]NUM41048.1 hypothetical protein [Leptospiraceae bacterium]
MQMYLHDKDLSGQVFLHKLSLKLLLKGVTPVLICKDRSFSFSEYLKTSRVHRIPFSVTGKLLFVSILNMYHLKDAILQLSDLETSENSYLPIFLDFTYHYLDEGVDLKESEYLFQKDSLRIKGLNSFKKKWVIFWEQGRPIEPGLQKFYRYQLEKYSQLKLEVAGKSISVKNKGGLLHGRTNADILKLFTEPV